MESQNCTGRQMPARRPTRRDPRSQQGTGRPARTHRGRPAWKTQANISPSKARDSPTITRQKNEPTKANANAEGRDRHTELIKTSGSANSERY